MPSRAAAPAPSEATRPSGKRLLTLTRALPNLFARSQRPPRQSDAGAAEKFAVSPSWFYAITTTDGSEYLALSAASGATIYAEVPMGTVIVPTTPLTIHQAAGEYLRKARESGGATEAHQEALSLEVSLQAVPLVMTELRLRGGFRNGWAERLQISGLRIISSEALAKATDRLPQLLESRARKEAKRAPIRSHALHSRRRKRAPARV